MLKPKNRLRLKLKFGRALHGIPTYTYPISREHWLWQKEPDFFFEQTVSDITQKIPSGIQDSSESKVHGKIQEGNIIAAIPGEIITSNHTDQRRCMRKASRFYALSSSQILGLFQGVENPNFGTPTSGQRRNADVGPTSQRRRRANVGTPTSGQRRNADVGPTSQRRRRANVERRRRANVGTPTSGQRRNADVGPTSERRRRANVGTPTAGQRRNADGGPTSERRCRANVGTPTSGQRRNADVGPTSKRRRRANVVLT
ncbi:unnamed protein product [Nesidiocoris tenuis]|uniref:Uncharacterized protein n=1 Tax=Nesidiocoris tenuis TaxID=355587 RepID=A0A6H5GJA5_9HEMI|nr:unnamed protein product [Nesidiocoris tenuis]